MHKELNFGDDARRGLSSGIRKMSSAVKSTLGPGGNTVILESNQHTRGLTVTKDGVTVAKSIVLKDPVENMAVRIMREAAEKTASTAGDGTTTAIVIAETMTLCGMENNVTLSQSKALAKYADEACEMLTKMSRPVSADDIENVATISANGDPVIGSMIASAYKEVGPSGIVSVERSQTSTTYVDTTKGIRFKRGYKSKTFVNDQRRDECIIENARILVSDVEISNILQIESILKPIVNSHQPLVIIADCSEAVVMTLAINVVKNGLKFCVVPPPSFGYRRGELMGDLALTLGAKYFSQSTGDDLNLATIDDLGFASKIVVGREETTITRGDTNQAAIDKLVSELYEQIETLQKDDEKKFVLERIAALVGSMSVIYVGGETDMEQKELYDRVDDAVCAVRSALAEGVLPGGGVALMYVSETMDKKHNGDKAFEAFYQAIRAPYNTIQSNAGVSHAYDYKNPFRGLNIRTGQVGEMLEMGVLDPTKVTKNALISATSVAATLLGTNVTIHESDQ